MLTKEEALLLAAHTRAYPKGNGFIWATNDGIPWPVKKLVAVRGNPGASSQFIEVEWDSKDEVLKLKGSKEERDILNAIGLDWGSYLSLLDRSPTDVAFMFQTYADLLDAEPIIVRGNECH